MSQNKSTPRRLPAYQIALNMLQAHYLLGPVARKITYCPYGASPPIRAWCQIQGEQYVYFNNTLKLGENEWLGVFSLAMLVLALGGPRHLKVPDPASDLAAQLAALYWWQSIRVGALPEHIELPADLLQWERLPLVDIATRIQRESPVPLLEDGDWTLTRSTATPLMLPGNRSCTGERPSITHRFSHRRWSIMPERHCNYVMMPA